MRTTYEIVRQENHETSLHRVLGKIVSGFPQTKISDLFASMLDGLKVGSARANDLLRIADSLEVSLDEIWTERQQLLLAADAELLHKRQCSAAESRVAKAFKMKVKKEEEEREAADRAAFEAWKLTRAKPVI